MYCALLFYDLQPSHLSYVALLQCLESFCFYNKALWPLLYLIPVTGLALIIKKNFYPSFSHVIVFIALCTMAHIYIIERLLLGIAHDAPYTVAQISAIILVEICFSLTIKYWGMQDNRA